jgi:hypothetical protein
MENRETVAPCGLYCGVCGIYMATAGNDEELKGKLAKAYGVSPADIFCRGCLSDTLFTYCKVCGIRACATEKGIEGCHRCDAFPCDKVEAFPVPEGKKNILRAVPRWRELGTEKWVEEEEKLCSCRSCGTRLFRGAKKCRSCNTLVG